MWVPSPEAPILCPLGWKRPWCWKRLKAEGEVGNREWDGWMVSLIQWKWAWANFRRWWGTGRPGVLQSIGLQTVRHDSATEQQQAQWKTHNGSQKFQNTLQDSWRRKWKSTPVFLTREFHGQRSWAGYSPWGHKDRIWLKWLSMSFQDSISVSAPHKLMSILI